MTATATLDALTHLAQLATELGRSDMALDASAARARLLRGEFVVAFVGHLKRGKSTLINALLGDNVLPTGPVPVTTVPTVVRFGEGPVVVRFASGELRQVSLSTLADYASAEGNRDNDKRVLAVEVLYPSPILEACGCFLDTSSEGRVFENVTGETHGIVHQVDVVVAVIGAEPPMAEPELRLIAQAAAQARVVYVVLNKSDRWTQEKRTAALAAARRAIAERIGRPPDACFEVSATGQLRDDGWWPDWTRLSNSLRTLAAGHREPREKRSHSTTVRRVLRFIETELDFRVRALTESSDDMQRDVASLVDAMRRAQALAAELKTALDTLEHAAVVDLRERAGRFLEQAGERAHGRLDESLAAHRTRHGPRYRRVALTVVQDVAREAILPWLASTEIDARDWYRASMRSFVDGLSPAWRGLAPDQRQLCGLDMEALADDLSLEAEFRLQPQVSLEEPDSPPRYLSDLLAGAFAPETFEQDAHRLLDWLLMLNVGQTDTAATEMLHQGRVRLQERLTRALEATLFHVRRIIEQTQKTRAAGALRIAMELTRLKDQRATLSRAGASGR